MLRNLGGRDASNFAQADMRLADINRLIVNYIPPDLRLHGRRVSSSPFSFRGTGRSIFVGDSLSVATKDQLPYFDTYSRCPVASCAGNVADARVDCICALVPQALRRPGKGLPGRLRPACEPARLPTMLERFRAETIAFSAQRTTFGCISYSAFVPEPHARPSQACIDDNGQNRHGHHRTR